jgi:hypothetical protein
MADPRQYRLRLGQVVIGLTCPDEEFARSLGTYFDRPCDPAPCDVDLDLHLVPHLEDPPVPNSLIIHKRVDGDRFDIADGLIRGHYDADTGRGALHVKTILTNGLMTRVFEQILYQAFHSAIQRTGYDACLVHSSGVIHAGAGYLFVGPSGAGKRTVAQLSGDHRVLNDEMNLVAFGADGPRLVGVPFNGHFREKGPGEAPLAAILLLVQDDRHHLEPVGPAEAAGAIAAQVTPPVGLADGADPQTPQAMIDVGSRLALSVPVHKLHFRRDDGFWSVLAQHAGPMEKG